MSHSRQELCSVEPPWTPAAVNKTRLGTTLPLAHLCHTRTHRPKCPYTLHSATSDAPVSRHHHHHGSPPSPATRLWLTLGLMNTVHPSISCSKARHRWRNVLRRAWTPSSVPMSRLPFHHRSVPIRFLLPLLPLLGGPMALTPSPSVSVNGPGWPMCQWCPSLTPQPHLSHTHYTTHCRARTER